jgi:hypothetical protein
VSLRQRQKIQVLLRLEGPLIRACLSQQLLANSLAVAITEKPVRTTI